MGMFKKKEEKKKDALDRQGRKFLLRRETGEAEVK